jgi:hypothetical protein
MNQVQDRSERKSFHSQDFVLWHYRSDNYSIPVSAVVVDEKEDKVIIRARVDGRVEEFVVDPNELIER